MKAPRFPIAIRRGSVSTKVYRLKRADGREVFTAAWHAGGARRTRQFPSFAEAHAEATMKADQLAAGRVDAAASLTGDDGETLREARKLCGEVPIMAALDEWAKARRLCRGSILPAAEAWAARNAPKFHRIKLAAAIDQFIAAKNRAGNEGESTYRAKLKPLLKHFEANPWLDEITPRQLDGYLSQFGDGVTRNDLRKRAVTLWRWARNTHHLPEGAPLTIESTLRAKETATQIGVISAATYEKLLNHFRTKYPEELPALVLAGFCGIRSDEIHGKRADRTRRQSWEDVHLDRKFVRVTVAKQNTPAWRYVPLCDAAIQWLVLCGHRKGPVCGPAAMERVRLLAIADGFQLPENCFRHSFISYRIAITGNKPQVATEAGNSVGEIDRRYRVPMTKEEGEEWFGIRPCETGVAVTFEGKAVANA